MKLKYSISCFVLMIILFLTFIYCYAFTNQYSVEQYAQVETESSEEIYIEEIILSNSDDVVNVGFYLFAENGYVVVYLYDKTTFYEYTDIAIDSLSVELQEEIRKGKYLETEGELYGFLENYSS